MKSEFIKYVTKGFRVNILILILIVPVLTVFSQSPGLTENDIILNAQALFDKKDYQAAIPLYAQLVSVHPDDPLFNYRFGVCTLFGDRKDKKKPIRYLNNAAKTIKDDPELFYFLGMAYHQNQEFANAMKYFNLYLSNLPSSSPERALILEKVNACLNGLNLADKNLVAEIVSTSKFQKDNFHRAYAAQDFNGSLVIKPEMFVSEKERKTGENSYVYLIHPSSVLYFSGFTTGENSNRDIFKVELDENGDWGIPEKADDILNTSFDENYPVLVDNGSTLYFCSKGHNSLGGYDIFRSTLNPETNKFDQPENLGPGVNSPFDDIVFIPTKDKSYAYFASDRDNLNGSINVYKIRLNENSNSGDQILAENKVENIIDSSDEQTIKPNNNSVNGTSNGNSEIASEQNNLSKPYSDASKKAATMVNDRTKSQALADSAFIIVTTTKELVRDLTNKRDRANAISQRKADESKTLELRFNESIALLAEATSEQQFLQDLDKSIKFKEDLYQLQQRSNHANKIAWNLGSQVKIKNQELETLKVMAGKIQTASVSGSFEETLLLFSKYKNVVTAIDTLVDYSEQLTAITNNKTTFNIPASELAFAENLKKAYKNNTLLAEMKTSKPVIDENIPIVIVDKTANGQTSNTVSQTMKESFVPAQLVLPVIYRENLALKDPGSEMLNIDFKIDNTTQALPLVNSVQYANVASKSTVIENIDLEINFNVDALAGSDIFALVQPVSIKQNSTLLAVSDQDIVINFDIDAVRPEKLVLPVEYAATDQLKLINEEIEISRFTDKPAILNSIAVIEPVFASNLVSKSFPEESLELNFIIDEAKPVKLVQMVENNYIAQNTNSIQEEIEIGLEDKTNQIQPEVMVQPVYSNYLAVNNIPEETGLEIGFEIDQVEPGKVVEQIQMNLLANDESTNDEKLEINNSIDGKEEMLIASVIEPVYSKPGLLLFSEENIEIDFQSDAVSASNLIVPVLYREKDVIDFAGLELEIEVDSDPFEAISVIEPVYYSSTGISNAENVIEGLELKFEIDESKPVVSNNIQVIAYKEPVAASIDIESELVLDFTIDKTSESYAIVTPVSFLNTPGGQDFMNDEPIEISFKIDPETKAGINSLNSGNMNPSEIVVKNTAVNSIEMKNNQDQIAVADEIYFLRDALMPTGGIESSKSDYEILYKALNNPDELSYEELLFAANMTDVQEEKLAIYNVAFIHIDRDWRAFNNAAVSAIHTEDLSKANCFLYQATLLSSDNGHIQNNMGILACHQNHFDKAEEYFVAASNLGYDAQYNLKLANGLSQIASAGKTSDQEKINNSEKTEDVIVDIIDYKSTEK